MIRDFVTSQDPAFLEGELVPDFVKTASLAPHPMTNRFPDTHFGLIVNEKFGAEVSRFYPIYDKDVAWKSAKYLAKNFEGMPKIAVAIAARSICGAAEMYSLDHVPAILKKLASMSPEHATRYYTPSPNDTLIYLTRKTAGDMVDGARSITVDGRVMPVRSMGELSVAEQWFDRNHTKLAQADKYRLAVFLNDCGKGFANDKTASQNYISPEVAKTASFGTFNPGFSKEMFRRATMCPNPKLAEAYCVMGMNDKIAMASGPLVAIDQLETLDVNSGLRDSYNGWIPDAISTVLCKTAQAVEAEIVATLEKTAIVQVKVASGEGLESDDLSDVPLSKLKLAMQSPKAIKLLGAKMAARMAANPAAISQLPEPVLSYLYAAGC